MTATLAPTAPTQGKRRGKTVLAVLLGAIIAAIPPLALYFLPPLRKAGEWIVNGFSRQDGESYDPAHPLETVTHAGFDSFLGIIVASSALSLLVAVAFYYALIKPLLQNKEDSDDGLASFIATSGGGIALAAVLIVFFVAIAPNSAAKVAEREEPAHVAQWVEDRYDLSLNESDAEALVEQARTGGDPVLIEGHLLNLTRIAQGGYVLTDDKSATELPVEH